MRRKLNLALLIVGTILSGSVWVYLSTKLFSAEFPSRSAFGKTLVSGVIFSFIVMIGLFYWAKTSIYARDVVYKFLMVRKIREELEPFHGGWNEHARVRFPNHEWTSSGQERILSVMIIDLKGNVTSTVRPGGHHHCYVWRHHITGEDMPHCREGFFTNHCRFVSREEGLKIAQAAGQIVKKHPSYDELYSEDMWNSHMHLDKPWDKT